jgi:hypothetical protein
MIYHYVYVFIGFDRARNLSNVAIEEFQSGLESTTPSVRLSQKQGMGQLFFIYVFSEI